MNALRGACNGVELIVNKGNHVPPTHDNCTSIAPTWVLRKAGPRQFFVISGAGGAQTKRADLRQGGLSGSSGPAYRLASLHGSELTSDRASLGPQQANAGKFGVLRRSLDGYRLLHGKPGPDSALVDLRQGERRPGATPDSAANQKMSRSTFLYAITWIR